MVDELRRYRLHCTDDRGVRGELPKGLLAQNPCLRRRVGLVAAPAETAPAVSHRSQVLHRVLCIVGGQQEDTDVALRFQPGGVAGVVPHWREACMDSADKSIPGGDCKDS